jgi:translation initiation factor 2B subunit (eIF-2B alpha/beta/delta family)
MPDEISLILNDRESGSLILLNRLISALEHELHDKDLSAWAFSHLLLNIRENLKHFAAIENFLASLIIHARQGDSFPGEAIRFIKDYRLHWQDSAGKIAENFLQQGNPEGLTILTHSHSQTVISLLSQLHKRKIPFRVLQTLSIPGGEGRKAHERMRQLEIQAELIEDRNITEALVRTDLILMGCDALLPKEFLNKSGTRNILELAKQSNRTSFLVTESRKKIIRSEWKNELTESALFEWVPLKLVDRVITEE